MPLITLKNLSLSFGLPPLLERVSLQIDANERVCLLGRNGAGKSTLLKLINGEIQADEGSIVVSPGIRLAKLDQRVPAKLDGTINEVVAAGLDKAGRLLQHYYHLLHEIPINADARLLNQLGECQHQLEAEGGWEISQRLEAIISKLQLDGDVEFKALSGGLKRRVLLARALVNQPDLLLLDEPTNHLDIESILWMEKFLLDWNGSLLFISHDRVFLQKLATRIVEIDRGRLTDWPGDYPTYLERKQKALDDEEKENALFDKKLAREEIWIRQGIKARRTRNEGRVRALQALRRERAERRNVSGSANVQIQAADRSGKIVIEATDITYAWDSATPVLHDFSTTIMRGDKVGIMGPNGAGKTTLIRLLLGDIQPQTGKVKVGTKLQIAYFDQHRAVLDEEKSVQDNIADGSDMVDINGKPRHVISYLRDFLFAPDRVRQPVKALSGGERNRLLLARLFSRPSNVLVLDEPTNDLDSDTLDLLEERLIDYPGTILLISHDRAFLDNVVTSTIVFEGHGEVNEYVGGYEDWLRQSRPAAAETNSKPDKHHKSPGTPAGKAVKTGNALSYIERQELGKLPAKLEKLEQQQKQLHQRMADAGFYRQAQAEIIRVRQQLAACDAELESVFSRWEELEEKSQ